MNKCYVIAEAGVNHNGNLDCAKKMISTAKEAGADAVKFQMFSAQTLSTKEAKQAEYQARNTKVAQTQFEMLKQLELPTAAFNELHEEAKSVGIDFIVTPFDLNSLHYIVERLNLPIIKIGSGDITFGPLLLAAARSAKKIILSTGMATMDEIQHALHVISFGLQHAEGTPSFSNLPLMDMRNKVTLLHCVSDYPARYHDMNLHTMKSLSTAFQVEVGLSDHTEGITIPIAAAALGCAVLEKHFTLDKSLEGPDHLASLDPAELTQMISSIRIVESALGSEIKTIQAAEQKNRRIVRRSIVAHHDIKKGEIFSESNLTFKRPEGGFSPMKCWELFGKKADRDYLVDEVIHGQ